VIEKGEPWGRPATAPADLVVTGGDHALAGAVARVPGALVRFDPDAGSDLARAVGLAAPAGAAPAGTELPMDVLALPNGDVVVNMLVVGAPPERLSRSTRAFEATVTLDDRPWFSGPATTVVVAVGQWRRGLDLVPRGHPGDGRAEVQVYALRPGERAAMRLRLAAGGHLPHPRIATRTARTVTIVTNRAVPVDLDGEAGAPAERVEAAVRAGAYRLLV
jgi:hypothetical protein